MDPDEWLLGAWRAGRGGGLLISTKKFLELFIQTYQTVHFKYVLFIVRLSLIHI